MSSSPIRFNLANRTHALSVLDAIQNQFPRSERSRRTETTTYYDTFDWRLFRKESFLSLAGGSANGLLRWQDLGGTLRSQSTIGRNLRFASDLPLGPMRDALSTVVEVRRLLPRFVTRGRNEVVTLRDDRQKTVVRVEFEDLILKGADSNRRGVPVPPTLSLHPVRGYGRQFRTAQAFLVGELGLEPYGGNPILEAAVRSGIEIGAYNPKRGYPLEPEMRAAKALRVVCLQLVAIQRANEDGVCRDLDAEFLHDFRVAVRKTRVVLTQFRDVLDPAVVSRYKKEFSQLGRITGALRDIHVHRQDLAAIANTLPPRFHHYLGPLEELLWERQRAERSRVEDFLRSRHYREAMRRWEQFLESSAATNFQLANAEQPIRSIASKSIWHQYRRVMRRGQSLMTKAQDRSFHRLRIECKKLRYLLEFFQAVFPKEESKPLLRQLKRLQDALGRIHDFEIQQIALQEDARSLWSRGQSATDTVLVLGQVTAKLQQQLRQAREEFPPAFSEFSAAEVRKSFRRFRALWKATSP